MLSRLVFLLLLLLFPACSTNSDKASSTNDVVTRDTPPTEEDAPPASAPAPEATAAAPAPTATADAWAAIRSGALLVDVRTQAEFAQGHLEGALLIPHDQIASRAGELGEDKSRAVVLYCRTGNRSSQAKKALESLGFTNVMNAGGYERLKEAE